MKLTDKLRAEGWKDINNGKFANTFDYLFLEKGNFRFEYDGDLHIMYADLKKYNNDANTSTKIIGVTYNQIQQILRLCEE